MAALTVGLSPHRVEFLPLAFALMKQHGYILLEEPPHPLFPDYLEGRISLERILEESESGFPEYTRTLYPYLRELHRRGYRILQIEPYLERVLRMQERLAEGASPEEVARDPELGPVYYHEHETFGRLLDFYSSMRDSFESLVEKICAFARADAGRLAFRDHLRAEALLKFLSSLPPDSTVYVEAGYIHLILVRELARRKPRGVHLRVRNLLLQALPHRSSRRLFPAPGDGLTSYYLFKQRRPIEEKLLAARSLIYIRLIEKNEIRPTPANPFPHLRDEIFWRAFVEGLDYADCKRLDREIRLRPTGEARRIACTMFPGLCSRARKVTAEWVPVLTG
ncbi:MAG TPA: hypothetical protein ENJ40_02875 [Thermosulfurimonas dismutans]|uniref:Uncharacterized protein n=1 Tax=Thermosulfurimonas dismutans TaxID=999894 RepID=A0A7C3CFH8_9BACT|nr:hypothetical protein [Thermosulfurimonas dismutans]